MKLKLATDLSLPLDAVTQTFLIVGKRGSGKSNTAARFVEQLHHARLPFVVLDPVDTWWGLKASREGGTGLDVYVFGGRKADLPLEAGGGALIAEVLCEHRLSMVLSVKHLSGRERSGFMVAFAQTLFQKWGGGPLHVVLEEAHELAPQMSGATRSQSNTDNEAAMLGAFKRLWKLGRSSGIGGTAVTQRPASLSKDITTQSEILIAHRTIGPQDVKAVGEWVKYHGEQLDMLAELPTLPTGEAFVWAPEFPEGKPIGLTRTAVLLRDTYDSASTPKVGEQRVEPKELADVDLERLRVKMAATIEKAKAEDPRELRRQIAELKKELAGKVSIAPKQEKPARVVERFVLKDGQIARLEKDLDRFTKAADRLVESRNVLADVADRLISNAKDIAAAITKTRQPTYPTASANVSVRSGNPPATPASSQTRRVVPVSTTSRPARLVSPSSHTHLGKGQHKVLVAIAQHEGGVTREQLTILTGYKRSSRDTYLQQLQQHGFVTTNGHGTLVATADGVALLGPDFEVLPTGDDLRAYWLERLPFGERTLLEVLVAAYPKIVDRDALSEATQYKRSSRDTYLQKLAARKLITSERDGVRASEELFS